MLFSFVAFVKQGPLGPQGGSILTKGTGCSREPPGSFEQPVSFLSVSSALDAQAFNYIVWQDMFHSWVCLLQPRLYLFNVFCFA